MQLLEAVLPDTVAGFMALTERHAAAGDADSSFATCQLLHTACSCLVRHLCQHILASLGHIANEWQSRPHQHRLSCS